MQTRDDRDEDGAALFTCPAANHVRQCRFAIRIAVISLSPTFAQDNDLARLSRRQGPELVLPGQFPTETPGRLGGCFFKVLQGILAVNNRIGLDWFE